MKQASKAGRFDPEAFVEGHEWIYAKTMPTIPHFYVLPPSKPSLAISSRIRCEGDLRVGLEQPVDVVLEGIELRALQGRE